MFASAFGLLVAVAVLTAEVEPVATEIDGDWKMVSYSIDGHEELDEKTDQEEPVLLRLRNGDGRLARNSKPGEPAGPGAKDSQGADDDAKIEYRLNPTQDPKQIDWIIKDADDKTSRTFQGIYRLKDDELVVCFTVTEANVVIDCLFGDGGPEFDMAESPRPTTFEPALKMIWTLKRAPAAKDSP